MISRRDFQSALAFALALSLACTPATALVSLNDGHDHIYVTGSAGWAWDSNLFANNDAKADSSQTASVVAEYQRRAGWIGVNVNAEVDSAIYNHFTAENFNNPKVSLELTKQTGRTTGSFTLSAARDSRADAAVNIRTTTWNYASGLNFRYPIVTIYTLSGQLGYSTVKYDGSVFPQLSTYTASLDLIRLYSSERDVMLGYRFRRGETSVNTSTDDHAFTAGLTGKLIRGLNGSLRAGYQFRVPHGAVLGEKQDSKFGSWTASASASYPINKRLSFTGTLAKDFSTTANDLSVDTTTAAIDAQYAFSSHWTFSANGGYGNSVFLGNGGLEVISYGPPIIYGRRRRDHYLTGSVAANYSLNEHLKLSASYVWFKNWSTLGFADFVRSAYNLNLSSRW